LSGNKLVTLEVTGLTHTFPGDLDYLLVGPGGQKFSLLSDSGGTGDVSNLTFTLNDAAATQPATQWVTGSFKPVNITAGDAFATPAPAAPYLEAPTAGAASFSSVFGTSGATMNGVWTLYVVDDAAPDLGTQAGWKLTFGGNDFSCSLAPASKRSDFDGDGRTDLSVFRGSEGNWYLNRSTAGFGVINFGVSSDVITPGDIDGDGKTDEAVFRPSATVGTPDFFVLRSSTNTVNGVEWGTTGDTPVVADYDGDNLDDFAIWRASTGDFFVKHSATNTIRHHNLGSASDKVVSADYNGDGKTDFAVFRPSTGTWFVSDNATNTITTTVWGVSTDIPVFADYDGDGKDDVAVFRPSNGTWYIRNSGGSISYIPFGSAADVPVPGDYDGDGKYDVAVYRAGQWFISNSTNAATTIANFGVATDRATPRAYLP
jgi:subtilisin-like proprotein convertase family protein